APLRTGGTPFSARTLLLCAGGRFHCAFFPASTAECFHCILPSAEQLPFFPAEHRLEPPHPAAAIGTEPFLSTTGSNILQSFGGGDGCAGTGSGTAAHSGTVAGVGDRWRRPDAAVGAAVSFIVVDCGLT